MGDIKRVRETDKDRERDGKIYRIKKRKRYN